MDGFDSAGEVDARIYRNPAVAIFGDTLGDEFRPGTHQHRRAARLHRLGPAPDGVEIDKFAMIFGHVFGPDFLHGKDALARHLPTVLPVDAMAGHLLGI